MRSLSAPEFLEVWERGLQQAPIQRMITLLAATYPEIPFESLVKLSIGQRNTLLLGLREQLFGTHFASLVKCAGCGEQLEANFSKNEIGATTIAEPVATLTIRESDYAVEFRLPNSRDLAAVTASEDLASAQLLLLERCILTAQHRGETIAVRHLPSEVIKTVEKQMAQADPQADVTLALTCPACGQPTRARFDIAAFLWSELSAWAWRLLQQVHLLASAYGWREDEILALSPWRRQCYLEMVKA